MLTVEDELYRKAVDQLAQLQARFEADRISAEAYRVGVESIWGVLGGVVDTPDFQELMTAADNETQALPREPRIRVYERDKDAGLIVVARSGEYVNRLVHVNGTTHQKSFDFPIEDEAVVFVDRHEQAALGKGFRREL